MRRVAIVTLLVVTVSAVVAVVASTLLDESREERSLDEATRLGQAYRNMPADGTPAEIRAAVGALRAMPLERTDLLRLREKCADGYEGLAEQEELMEEGRQELARVQADHPEETPAAEKQHLADLYHRQAELLGRVQRLLDECQRGVDGLDRRGPSR